MFSGETSFITIKSHILRKCWRCAYASSLGNPLNGFAYTIMIRSVFNSKFTSPMFTMGPLGMLATIGMEYLCSVLLAMVFGTDDVGVTNSIAGGVVEGGSTWGWAFFRNDSGFLVKVVSKSKPSYTILFSSTTGKDKQSYPVMINGYYTCILSWKCPKRFF